MSTDSNSQRAGALTGAGQAVHRGFASLLKDPQILLYPFMALIFISATYPLLRDSIFARWYDRIFADASVVVPHKLAFIIGLVAFSVFYAALITAYFTVAISAATLAKLEGRRTKPLYGLLQVVKHFFRVSRFAFLAVFFFPVGIYVQRRNLPKGWLGVAGSSLTLHMAQVSPEILATKKSFGATIRDAVDVLGQKWQEGLIIKIGMYAVFTLIVILPKLIEHGFFSGPTAHEVGWLVSLELGASGYVLFKVLNSVFTTTLYYQAKSNSNKNT